MLFFLIKFFITVSVVIGLSETAKRINPNLAGILMGLPLGAGITTYFFTLEQGVPFMLGAVPWAVAGLSASLLFTLVYVLAGRVYPIRGRILPMVVSTVSAASVFFVFVVIISLFAIDMPRSLVLTAAVMIFNVFILRGLGIRGDKAATLPTTFGVLIFRSAAAGLSITIITGLARVVGPSWSGLISTFPVMTFPLLLALHYEEGDRIYPGVVYGFAFGVSNLVIFYTLASVLLPRFSLNTAFVLLYSVSALYLWGLNKIRSRLTAY
jgi:hypothetical protein